MSRFFLVRHGETIWHDGNRYAGVSDIPLTPLGVQQAAALGVWSRDAGLTHIYVSPLQRARDTAAAAQLSTGLVATVEPRLREVSFGQAEGLTAAEQAERFPDVHAAFLADPGENPLPGGESGREAVKRARPALDEISAACGPDARVLIVAHNTLFRLLLCDLLGVSLGGYRRLFPVLRNGAVTEIDLHNGRFALHSLNVPL